VIFTPKIFKALTILNTSSERNKLEITLVPIAKAENSKALCDIDLSDGGLIIPDNSFTL